MNSANKFRTGTSTTTGTNEVHSQMSTMQQLEWMIPSNEPDETPIQRIQSAFPNETLDTNITDSILCQVRLKVEIITSVVTTNFGTNKAVSLLPTETCTVSDRIHSDATSAFVWTLETLNQHGQPTAPIPNSFQYLPSNITGGAVQPQHELYLVFHAHEHSISGNRPFAIGVMTPINKNDSDNAHGHSPYKHSLRWVASPMNSPISTSQLPMSKRGHVSIHFQYSLGMGSLPPPHKHDLLHGGAIQTCYLCPNVVVPSSYEQRPNATNTQAKITNDCTLISLQPFRIPTITKRLSSYDIIIAYGDSILEQLVASRRYENNNSAPPKAEPRPRIHFGPKIASPLNHRTMASLFHGLDSFVSTILRDPSCISTLSIALLLNSALWDVLSDEATTVLRDVSGSDHKLPFDHQHNDPWKEHIEILRQYLSLIQTRYPTIRIHWVLPTAVHIHRVHVLSDPLLLIKAPQKIARTKYMSSSRTYQLYQRQKDVIVSLNDEHRNLAQIWCVDIYEATFLSADWTLPGDGRHYRSELNQRMLSWFY